MKKSNLAIALTALTSLSVLAGCSDVTKQDGLVLSMTGLNGESIEYTADELFGRYKNNATGISTFYNAIYEVVIRNLFESQPAKRSEIYEKASRKVSGVKETAKSNAESNKSKYDDELETLLESYSVEDLDQLKEHFAYELMKEEAETQFYKSEESWASGAWKDLVIGEREVAGDYTSDLKVDVNGDPVYPGYLETMLPYHVKHILVKVSAGSNTFHNGTISEAEALKLSSVIKRLALRKSNETFGAIAREASEDTGSAANYGDLGIMNKNTSFVNEFKLGVYAYDAIYNASIPAANKDKINIPADQKNYLTTLGLGEIPYEAALKLESVANKTKDSNGHLVNEGETVYYPRNVYFNKYFNKHNVSVITPNSVNAANEIGVEDPTIAALSGFQAVAELGGKKVLTDEKGRVVLVVRAGASSSYEGVHFIVIERSALVDVVDGVSLENYYTIETPGSTKYPKYTEVVGAHTVGEEMKTYVNFITSTSKTYKDRATTVETDIKGFDSMISYRIFEKLYDFQNVEIYDVTLRANIFDYISNQRSSNAFDKEESENQIWESWIETLQQQKWARDNRLISETCAINFDNASTAADFQEGGACYYAK